MISPFILSFALSTSALAQSSIPELAVQSGRLDTLVTAVQTAGLLETLGGEGPFTVFAPTDEAFARIDGDTLTTLLEELRARIPTQDPRTTSFPVHSMPIHWLDGIPSRHSPARPCRWRSHATACSLVTPWWSPRTSRPPTASST